jgi:drug/metabolite transporter (DMT)-like permease
MRMSDSTAVAAPVLFVLLWSTGFIGAKYGLPYAEPMTFLSLRMAVVVLLHIVLVFATGARWPNGRETAHSIVTGSLVHGLYLGGVFVAISQGVPAGISALIPGLQPILTATIANRWLGEKVSGLQWIGLALGLAGVALVLHDHAITGPGSWLGWGGSFVSLIGITLGTLYQKRFGGGIDWRTGNLVQYVTAGTLFTLAALVFETYTVRWSGEFVFAVVYLAVVLSIGAVALMYWLIRRSAATGFSSLFYLVPAVTALFAYVLFGERLDHLSIVGILVCAAGVVVVSRGAPANAAAREVSTT